MDGLTGLAPMLGLVAPAYMMFEQCRGAFGFPAWVAVLVAGAVEALGISSIHTTMTVWQHNQRYKDRKNQVPVWIPLGGLGFYLVILTVVVVLGETQGAGRVMLVWLSVPGAVIWGVRESLAQIQRRLRRSAPQKRAARRKPAPAPAFECPGCGKRFAKQQGLAAHWKHRPEHRPKGDKHA